MVEVINHSSLPIVAGSSDYGYVAYYAKEVHTGESKIVNQNGYLFCSYDGTNYLLGYAGTDTDLLLPDDYQGESYEIYQYAFYQCTSLTSVTIGSGVQSIGDYAFRGCSNLESVTIPDSVKSIGSYAFYECKNLTTIDFNEGLEIIGYAAFASDLWSDKGPKYFTLPKSLKEIRYFAFKDVRCTDLVIPENVEVIDTHAFHDCGAVKTVTLKCKTPPAVSNSVAEQGKYYNQFSIGSGYPKISIPASMVSAYRNSVWWNYYIVNNQYLTY